MRSAAASCRRCTNCRAACGPAAASPFRATSASATRIVRRSVIQSVTQKEGASGPLVFVTVRHEIGRDGEAAADRRRARHRLSRAGGPAVKAAPKKAEPGAWRRELMPDAVQLFRYSALTFNGHRIHYDRDYVTREEGYPGSSCTGR